MKQPTQNSSADARSAPPAKSVVKAPDAKPQMQDPAAKPAAKAEAKAKKSNAKPAHKRLHRHSLEEYLEKAGYEITADRFRKKVKYLLLSIVILATVVFLTLTLRAGTHTGNILLGVLLLWTIGFALLWLLTWGGVYFYLDYRVYQRTKELEEVLPDFLQLASSNIAAGMPVDRALWYSIRPSFGVLAKEMEDVAKATMAGEDLEVSLLRMTKRYDSVVLHRSINILIEGMNAGGEMADLLNKIALNIEEMKIMKKEMAASVTTYAIFITFASVMIAPILFALATELLGIIIKITGSLDLSATSSMLTLAAPNPAAVANFKIFSILMLIVLTFFSAAIVSVIKKGNVYEGIKTMPAFAAIALIIYFIASALLHSLLSGII